MRKRRHRQSRLSLKNFLKIGWKCGLALMLSLTVLHSGCRDKTSSRDYDTGDEQSKEKFKRSVVPVADAEAAVIETENPAFGKIVIELYPNIAPKMVERFKLLIKEGFYNGTTFHRINAPVGLIQGGSPLSKDDNPDNDAAGDSPYPNLPAEFSDILYERGAVGAARDEEGAPGATDAQLSNTANCQFYITLKRQDAFDGRYTLFGRVIEGLSNADIISHAPVEAGTERPTSKIVIKSITLQPRSNFK